LRKPQVISMGRGVAVHPSRTILEATLIIKLKPQLTY